MKKHILSIIIVLFSFSAFSLSKDFAYADYSLTAFYPETVQPGDAVFVRLVFETTGKKTSKDLIESTESGELVIFRVNDDGTTAEKATSKSQFYKIEKTANKKSVKSVLLSGAPLSSWAKAGNYTAKITYSAFNREEAEIALPIRIIEKEFVSETIPLNASNTAIKTNTSTTRTDQINRLNKILGTKNPTAVYEPSSFTPPNPATRRTSFFADRRVYAYNNGKSSTSLHYGIDYGVPTGSEVRSCGRGKVVMAEDRISTGWSVCIEHLPGLYSLYYHMSELKCEVGQMVNQGDLIGLSGATGLATGPHLHWEIRLNMEAVSPDFFVSDFTFKEEAESKKK